PPRIRRSLRDRGCHGRRSAPRPASPFRFLLVFCRPCGRSCRMFAASASDPLLILLLALAIDLAGGDMAPVFRYLPPPVVIVRRAVGFFDRPLHRPSRS